MTFSVAAQRQLGNLSVQVPAFLIEATSMREAKIKVSEILVDTADWSHEISIVEV